MARDCKHTHTHNHHRLQFTASWKCFQKLLAWYGNYNVMCLQIKFAVLALAVLQNLCKKYAKYGYAEEYLVLNFIRQAKIETSKKKIK